MTCSRWPGCGCGTQSGPHSCEGLSLPGPADSPKQIYDAVYRELTAARAEVARLTDELQDCQSRAITSLHELRAEAKRLTAAMVAAIQEDYREGDPHEVAWKLAFFRVKGILRQAMRSRDE
jgi:hypothetical protein